MPLPTGAIIGIGAGTAGANLAGQGWANYSNQKLARENREWQEYMANTRYQRTVADMKEANLNPMLAVTGKADAGGIPSGNQATVSNPLQAMGGVANMLLEISNQKHKNELMDAQSNKANTESDWIEPMNTSTLKLNDIIRGLHQSSIYKNAAQTGMMDANTRQINERTNLIDKQIDLIGQEMIKRLNENYKIINQGNFDKSWLGKTKTYTDNILDTAKKGADVYTEIKYPAVHQAIEKKRLELENKKFDRNNRPKNKNIEYYDKNNQYTGSRNEWSNY